MNGASSFESPVVDEEMNNARLLVTIQCLDVVG